MCMHYLLKIGKKKFGDRKRKKQRLKNMHVDVPCRDAHSWRGQQLSEVTLDFLRYNTSTVLITDGVSRTPAVVGSSPLRSEKVVS